MNWLQLLMVLMASMPWVQAGANDYQIFCYWDINSSYYKNSSQFFSWDLDVNLCTHLVYGSTFLVDEQTGALKLSNKELLNQHELLRLGPKFKKRGLQKMIFSVGGFNQESSTFSKMVGDTHKRDSFFNSVIEFMQKWQFDGIQIDWQFPTQRGGQAADRRNFILFLEELKIILKEHRFLLLAAVSGRLDKLTLASYDIPRLTKNVDYVSLMMHDQRDVYSLRLGHIAPYGYVERAVKYWAKHSHAPSKLILGIPFFVRSFTMHNNHTGVGSPSQGPGLEHPYSRQPGFMTYGEWCVQSSTWKRKFDAKAQVPYAFKGNQWVSYEDGRSIGAKMRLLKTQRLAGAMLWSVDADDYKGLCGEPFTLLRLIVTAIGDTRRLTTEATTTEGLGLCPRDGLFRHPWDCKLFHECRDGQRINYECIAGYYFDEQAKVCKLEKLVKCEQNFVTWRPGMKRYNMNNLPLNLKLVMY